jgi:glycosyltransferase involved in cell wall biosynthesis
MKIVVDGSIIGKSVTGVGRFAYEVLNELAKIKDLDITLALSKDIDLSGKEIPENIKIVRRGKKNNKFWQFFTLKKIAKKEKGKLLCMANFSPLFKKDFLVLHDVTYLDNKDLNDKFWAFKYKIFAGFRLHKHKIIFTVSNFSKERILYHYKKVKDSQVVVVASGANQWKNVEPLKPKFDCDGCFLAVGSMTKNKNFEYIRALAKNNPDKKFIIVGRVDNALITTNNLITPGYLSNEELCYLYKNCKGFILPSLYEGFGLPPLEALECGCKKIILSNIDVFKEVYGSVANFFDPKDYKNTVNLDNIKEADEESIKALLEKYNWPNIAKKIYLTMKEN